MIEQYGLGRLPAADNRDGAYAIRTLLAQAEPAPAPTKRSWFANGWWGDQLATSRCVAFAWTHWLEDGPLTQRGPTPIVDPLALYARAQELDEWPGSDYDGTSVRAGAKALQELGLIESYLWAFDAATIVDAILRVGPVVVGTDWYSGMFDPDAGGLLHLTGGLAGGHAYVLDGANTTTGLVRVKNSWGRAWGRHGFAALRFDDLDRLIEADGEACLAVELRR